MKRHRRVDGPTLRMALAAAPRLEEAASDNGVDDHPIDAEVDNAPTVVRLRKKLTKARAFVERQLTDRRSWVAHQDLETAYRSVREHLYFDIGFTFGLVTGRSEQRLSKSTRELARKVRTVALMARLPAVEVVSALQETAWAMLRLDGGSKR